MKLLLRLLVGLTALALTQPRLSAYERTQGPTEVLYWNRADAFTGYTLFGARGTTYLIDMEGKVAHTWPVGTNPHLLDDGSVLDASGGEIEAFPGLKEVDWAGNTIWAHNETRSGYTPHHDFIRIHNPKLGADTTLYIASKFVTHAACIDAGCNPANGPYINAQVDAVIEVDRNGNVVWEWCFFDHGIQDVDPTKANYVGSGKSISSYPGRLNLNLPGRPINASWLRCNALDYNSTLDQIVINASGGEFYIIDHGSTFVPGDPAASILLAAGTKGDFLYRFGDPARYGQGNPPSIQQNWSTSTTGNKQIGGSSDVQWIHAGLPGAGRILVFNNGGDLFETTPQSYVFEINPFLDATTNTTSAYVNPPTAGYNNWAAPGHDTDKRTKSISRQIVWMYYSMANQGMFSHLDSGVQRLPNGNTLICDSTEGHLIEVTAAGVVVWEYINPVSADGVTTWKRDQWPMHNALFRAYRYSTNYPAFASRALTADKTITGSLPAFIAAPAISATTLKPAEPTADRSVWVQSLITSSHGVWLPTLTYTVDATTNAVEMMDDGLHQDGAAGDGVYGAEIPVYPGGTTVGYRVSAQDEFGLTAQDPSSPSGVRYAYTVKAPQVADAPYDVLLGRPTDRSIAASVLPKADIRGYLQYGTSSGVYTAVTATNDLTSGTPAVFTLEPLQPNTPYFYCVRYQAIGGAFVTGPERRFVTQRAKGTSFTFDIEADPHHLDNDPPVWRAALTNMLADNPDFVIDLGDTFMDEKLGTNTEAGAAMLCREVRTGYFSILGHSAPLFLVNGNHDPESGWLLNTALPEGSLPVWGTHARQQYFPGPLPGAFYSMATAEDQFLGSKRDSYYAFEWGDALFVVLDPFWNTCQGTTRSRDPWSWTLGADQYAWLNRTLTGSSSTLKFVFIHHLVGGSFDGIARGGVEMAPYFEWGGRSTNGTWGFTTYRPGWETPIQNLLLANGVNAVFHGHDHLFVKQDLDANSDGVVDLVYQEVPQPSRTNYNAIGAATPYGYTNGVMLGNSGHLRVTVTPTNSTVAYVRAFPATDEGTGKTNRMVSHSYNITPKTIPITSFAGTVVPGRPTGTSVSLNVLSPTTLEAYVEAGPEPGTYEVRTAASTLAAGVPTVMELSGLPSDKRCYYRLRFKSPTELSYRADLERSFHTQRASGSSFVFDVQSDSHIYDKKGDTNLYQITEGNIAADAPDFLLDLGDTFGDDHNPTTITALEMEQLHLDQRPFFDLAGRVAPVFLCIGNHEGETIGYEQFNTAANPICSFATEARLKHFPNPFPNGFYSGNTNADVYVNAKRTPGLPANYYAWEWGDALFVVLDAYRYLPEAKPTNLWDWTLGQAQYNWFKQTLEASNRKYRFVFAHHVLGQTRGATAWAGKCEWGGQNNDGSWGFAGSRPGWPTPIHQLMATNKVTIFFQGHDHLYAKEQLDGVVYQEVPMPSDATYHVGDTNASAYLGTTINNSGHLRITVAPEGVTVDYVRSLLPLDATPGLTNGTVSGTYTVAAPSIPGRWTMLHLPDTGQTQSFTSTFGEDADYSINPPSFTDQGNGTVRDNVTGLTWQKADGGEMTWPAAQLYARTNRVGLNDDWRLPTIHEAFSILNHGTVNPALDTNVFTSSAAQYWWTADTQATDTNRVWTINAGGGLGAHRQDETVSAGGTNRYHVRCVRGPTQPGAPKHHLKDNLDGTITDLDTGLTWQQAESATSMTWEGALKYAKEFSIAGRTG